MKTKQKGFICCLCGERKMGWGDKKQYGNNPSPIKHRGECCEDCNNSIVIPRRIKDFFESQKQLKEENKEVLNLVNKEADDDKKEN